MVIRYEGNIGLQLQQMLTSLSQDNVATFVIAFLKRHQIPFKRNAAGDIYYLNHPNTPVLRCSLDEVGAIEEIVLLYQLEWEGDALLSSKEGFTVVLQLKMLQKYPHLNFEFKRNPKELTKGMHQQFLDGQLYLV